MVYIATGCLGFLVIHTFDIVSLKKIPALKPFIWILGGGLLGYALTMASLHPEKLPLPGWSSWLGWSLLVISTLLLLYSLFGNLPFHKTYIATGVGDKLIRSKLYSLVRHPGVLCFGLVLLSLVLVSRSNLMLTAALIFMALDIVLVIAQDRFFFVRMFDGYRNYQKDTPMLLPNKRSMHAFINSLKSSRA
jgi:protein-S-isoprenylcysteine O-methyltransferase Ste14